MKELFVIIQYYTELELDQTIIGVSDSVDQSKEMIKDYFGETFEMVSFEDIRDSDIEYRMLVKSCDGRGGIDKSSVIVYSHTLNKI